MSAPTDSRALAGFALLAIFASTPSIGDQQPTIADLVPVGVLQEITDAKTVGDLERIHGSVVAPDITVEVAYGLRLCELGRNKPGENILLESLPRNRVEFVFLFSVPEACKKKGLSLSDRLCMIPDTYLVTVGKLLPGHRKYYARFLTLSVFADGYVAEDLDSINRRLEQADRPAFVSALRELAPSVRERICGKCVDELRR